MPYRHIGTCEYEFLYYVDMYKVYIGNYTRNYCMCTQNKCIYIELSIHGLECKAYVYFESIQRKVLAWYNIVT